MKTEDIDDASQASTSHTVDPKYALSWPEKSKKEDSQSSKKRKKDKNNDSDVDRYADRSKKKKKHKKEKKRKNSQDERDKSSIRARHYSQQYDSSSTDSEDIRSWRRNRDRDLDSGSQNVDRKTKYVNEREIDMERLNEIDDIEAGELDTATIEMTDKIISGEKNLEELDAFIVPKTLAVQNLPDKLVNKDLWDYFRPFGPIAIVKLVCDRITGHSRRFGFIEYERDDSIDKVLAKSDHLIHGCIVKVSRAWRKKSSRIYVGDLPSYIKNKELTTYFEQFGTVEDVVWPRNSTIKNRNYCFVVMKNEAEALAATKKTKVIFGDRWVTIFKCDGHLDLANRNDHHLFEVYQQEIYCDNTNLYSGHQWMGRGGNDHWAATQAALTSYGRMRQKQNLKKNQKKRRDYLEKGIGRPQHYF